MKGKILGAIAALLSTLSLSAQVEVMAPETEAAHLSYFQAAVRSQKNDVFKQHLERLSKSGTAKQKINAARIARDLEGVQNIGPVLCYSVPAMSETQYLPDAYPFDGKLGPVRIISAQDEYEPGSFVLYALSDQGKVQFEVSDLKAADGATFSKNDLDLKVIKVWYQNGNGWYSYFQDNGLKLCPELLLNDEDLIKVDTKRVANYARLTEKDGSVSYRWLTPDRAVDNRSEDSPNYYIDKSFQGMKENFMDAPTFRGATLNEGEFKQFFLTAHVKKGQKPGYYAGTIKLSRNGQTIGVIPVTLRVLPFALPKPKTYLNPDKDFLVFMCEYVGFSHVMALNGNDEKLARKQLVSLLKDFVAHNEPTPNFSEAIRHLDIAKEAGQDLSVIALEGMHLGELSEMRFDVRRKTEKYKRLFGKSEGHFLHWGDEYGLGILRGVRPMVEIYQAAGFRFPINSQHGYAAGGYLADIFWPPTTPDYRNHVTAEKMNALDGYFGWYANQHVGVENPAFIRRQYGLAPYRAGYSCFYNYAHHLNGYSDIRGDTYKSMNFVYGDGKGVIDTLAWEGFREGLDDIRYATLLLKLANERKNSKDVRTRYAAKKAIQYIADMNTDDFDQTTARLEMIRHILTLQALSK